MYADQLQKLLMYDPDKDKAIPQQLTPEQQADQGQSVQGYNQQIADPNTPELSYLDKLKKFIGYKQQQAPNTIGNYNGSMQR